MKNYNKNKKSLYLKYWDVIYMDEQCLRSYFLAVLSGLKKHFNLMKVSWNIFYPEELHELYDNLSFFPERMESEKVKNLFPTCMIKKNNMLYIEL